MEEEEDTTKAKCFAWHGELVVKLVGKSFNYISPISLILSCPIAPSSSVFCRLEKHVLVQGEKRATDFKVSKLGLCEILGDPSERFVEVWFI